jgi:hypothetical protein
MVQVVVFVQAHTFGHRIPLPGDVQFVTPQLGSSFWLMEPVLLAENLELIRLRR